jgi:hypothetical protein
VPGLWTLPSEDGGPETQHVLLVQRAGIRATIVRLIVRWTLDEAAAGPRQLGHSLVRCLRAPSLRTVTVPSDVTGPPCREAC